MKESAKHRSLEILPATENLGVSVELIKKATKLLGFKVRIMRIAVK